MWMLYIRIYAFRKLRITLYFQRVLDSCFKNIESEIPQELHHQSRFGLVNISPMSSGRVPRRIASISISYQYQISRTTPRTPSASSTLEFSWICLGIPFDFHLYCVAHLATTCSSQSSLIDITCQEI